MLIIIASKLIYSGSYTEHGAMESATLHTITSLLLYNTCFTLNIKFKGEQLVTGLQNKKLIHSYIAS